MKRLLLEWLLLVLLAACNIPDVECLSHVGANPDDAGTCSAITAPGDCAAAEDLKRQLEGYLPCNTCIAYICECQSHWFCKTCGAQPDGDSWGCNPSAPAWCGDP